MEAQGIINALLGLGPGGILAAVMYMKWQKAEDRNDKLRDALELKQKEYYESLLLAQRAGFDNSLRVEGVLMNATQVIAANNSTIQAIVSNKGHGQ